METQLNSLIRVIQMHFYQACDVTTLRLKLLRTKSLYYTI